MKGKNSWLILGALVGPILGCWGQVTQFDWPSTAEMSDKYDVVVYYEDQEYDLYTHISEPNLNVDPLYPDETDGVTGIFQDRSLSYVQFDYDGSITVEVTKLYGDLASRVEIQPKALGIEPHYFDGRTVRFRMAHHDLLPSYVHVHFISDDNVDGDGEGGDHVLNAMMVFGNKPEVNKPDKTADGVVVYSESADLSNADIIYFEPGDYDLTTRFTDAGEVGQLPYTRTGQKVYMEGGAVVRGAFHGKDFNDIWLYGRGIVTGRDLAWHWFRDDEGEKDAYINFQRSNNPYIEGIIIDNPTHHTIPSGENSTIKDLKIIGWASNHDGIRPKSGSVAERLFIKTSDDYDYARDPHEVKNSVLWPAHNGAVGMLGWNDLGTGHAEYRNIAFINSETRQLDKMNSGIVGSMADDGIQLSDNVYEDLYIEGHHAFLVNAIQTTTNGGAYGYLNDFVFKNIRTERPFMITNGTLAKQNMKGIPNNWISGWTFTNLVVAGELVTWDNYQDYFDLNLTGDNGTNEDAENYVRNVTFNTDGQIYEISISSNTGGKVFPEGNGGVVQCPAGMGQMLNIVPDEGYRITDVTVDGESLGRRQTILFEEVSGDHAVSVTFEMGDDYYDIDRPADIADLSASVLDCDKVELVWTDVDHEDEYRVNRRVLDEDGNVIEDFVSLADIPAESSYYLDDSAEPNVSYEYAVSPVQDDVEVASSNYATAETPTLCIPPDISDLSATADECFIVELTWTDTEHEEEYRVSRQEVDDAGNVLEDFTNLADVPAGSTSYLDDAVEPNSIYQYLVSPVQQDEIAATSNQVEVVSLDCFVQDVTDLAASATGCNSVELAWSDVEYEEGYQLSRREMGEDGNPQGDFVILAELSADATSYSDQSVEGAVMYAYMVEPKRNEVVAAASNLSEVSTPICDITDLLAVSTQCDQMSLSWSAVNGAENYLISRKVGAENEYAELATLTNTETAYTDEGLNRDETYYYQVEPVVGGQVVAASNEASDTTPLCSINNIGDLAVLSTSCESVELIWTDVEYEEGYLVERRLYEGTTYEEVALLDANSTSFVDDEVSESTSYVYQVSPMQLDALAATSNLVLAVTEACAVLSAEETSEYKVYPNPARDTLYMGWHLSNPEVQILDTSGRTIQKTQVIHDKLSISHLGPGTYFLLTKENVRIRFVKE